MIGIRYALPLTLGKRSRSHTPEVEEVIKLWGLIWFLLPLPITHAYMYTHTHSHTHLLSKCAVPLEHDMSMLKGMHIER
jgi:hypothetical protein